jgi:hypothetical protein
MAAGLNEIIAQLEQQRDAIDRALSALREVEGRAPASAVKAAAKTTPAGKPAKKQRKGGMSAEGKERLVAALKARWAAKKAAAEAPAPPAKRGRPKKSA